MFPPCMNYESKSDNAGHLQHHTTCLMITSYFCQASKSDLYIKNIYSLNEKKLS